MCIVLPLLAVPLAGGTFISLTTAALGAPADEAQRLPALTNQS
jgi:hypothetical protein